jgi:hypothetical protein
MDRDVSAACQMFLIPSTILFTALANAGTEGLKLLIGVMGLATALIWLARLGNWKSLSDDDRKTSRALATIFIIAWLVVTCAHAYFGWTGGFTKTA